MSDLDRALDLLLASEGGWSNRVADRGGATMYGITQATYDAWRRKMGRPLQSVRLVQKDEIRELYESEFWRGASCDKLPWPISYLTFDAAVNSGPVRAKKWTQTGLGVAADGIVGPATIAAANGATKAKIVAIVQARRGFMVDVIREDRDLIAPLGGELPARAQINNLGGWWARTLNVLATGLGA